MSVTIVHDNYGKSRVQLMKVARRGEFHELQNVTVKIAFEGNFTAAHINGDNSLVLPTDTMKNTVYALAQEMPEIEEIENFAQRLADYFLKHMTNNRKIWISFNLIEIAHINREKQFVILTAIDCNGRTVDIEFLANIHKLRIQRQLIFI